MFLKCRSSLVALLFLLGLLSLPVHAQFSMSAEPARLGESFDVSVSGAYPNSEYLILLDTDPGPTFFPLANNLRVDLGFSSNIVALPVGLANASGDSSITLISNEANAVGVQFYVQAINIDPVAPFGISVSNPARGTVHPQVPGTGTVTPLTLTDDGFALVPLGFSFPFYGQSYTEAYVNANGTVSFGQGNATFFVTESFFLSGPPTIAPLWSDLNPELGGTVSWDTTSTPGSTMTFRWTNVIDNIQGGPNTFSMSIDANGHVIMDYGNCVVTDCIAGKTAGMAATANSFDLSAPGWTDFLGSLSVYEDFTSGGFDLQNNFNLFANTFMDSSTYYH
ncbi:MAG: hypothetical protein ACI97A_000085 [Planctomycetota bacterium]|jgi:hypothetical protein